MDILNGLILKCLCDFLPFLNGILCLNREIVKEAIMRELQRGGQVYYLHNKVATINKVAADLQLLVPNANVKMAHGQMRVPLTLVGKYRETPFTWTSIFHSQRKVTGMVRLLILI